MLIAHRHRVAVTSCVRRRSCSICSGTAPRSASLTRRYPDSVTVATTGQIPRVWSGPPVAESSSDASTSASTATFTAASASRPGRHSFLSEPRANTDPEPTAWWSCSS